MSEGSEKPRPAGMLSKREMDRIEAEMIKGRFERREYAGDPKQPLVLRVLLKRNRKK
jgi:hypothetical protein